MTESEPQDPTTPLPTVVPGPDEATSTAPVATQTAVPTAAEPDGRESARHAVSRPAPVPPPASTESVPATREVPTVAVPFAEPDEASAPPAGRAPVTTPRTAPVTGAPPAPPLPPTPPTPPVATSATVAPGQPQASAQPEAAATQPADAPQVGAPTPVPPVGEPDYDFPAPHPPSAPGVGSHLLGVLVGLVLAPVGALAVLLGQSRVLVVQTDHWDGSTEWLGIALVAVGTVLLGTLLLLAGWTAAAPVTGGAVLTALGAVALALPDLTHTQVLALLDSEGWHATIVQTVVAATSGTLFAVGALLLVGGLAAAATRRRGLRLGAFRERNRD